MSARQESEPTAGAAMASKTRQYRVINDTRHTVLAESSKSATNPVTRGVGLTGRKSLPEGGGLIIRPCNSVVSFLMRFPIDVIFLDERGQVCHLIKPLVPWRASKMVRGSRQVVELPAGTIDRTGTQLGDTIQIVPVASE